MKKHAVAWRFEMARCVAKDNVNCGAYAEPKAQGKIDFNAFAQIVQGSFPGIAPALNAMDYAIQKGPSKQQEDLRVALQHTPANPNRNSGGIILS